MVAKNSTPGRESDRVEEELRRMIITLELRPGAMVSEAYLTKLLNCGRTPLREALQRLAQEYLIESVPRHGISIAGLGLVDFVDLIEAIVLVEGFSARIAAGRITDEELAKMEEIITRAEEASEKEKFSTVAELDYEFHCVAGQATGNRYLADTIARLHRLATRFGYIAWRHKGSSEMSLMEHRQILAAFKSRNPDEAERQTREHTLRAKERIVASF
ncbi:MAG: GntR family transcriptional regulator [Chloroflexota bacterium]|nr:GntR family transcriptional regulator [Chloroflexota bacterium]